MLFELFFFFTFFFWIVHCLEYHFTNFHLLTQKLPPVKPCFPGSSTTCYFLVSKFSSRKGASNPELWSNFVRKTKFRKLMKLAKLKIKLLVMLRECVFFFIIIDLKNMFLLFYDLLNHTMYFSYSYVKLLNYYSYKILQSRKISFPQNKDLRTYSFSLLWHTS